MGTPQFFEIPELVLEVLDLCNIAQLTALSTTCRHMAAMGERSMQGRVRRGLRKLLQDDAILAINIIRCLGNDGGIIVGSFTQALMHSDHDRSWEPRDLNIVVPKNRGTELRRCLEGYGYKCEVGEIRNDLLVCCDVHQEFHLPEAGVSITVSEARGDNVLEVLLTCGNSATMNALTPRRIYSFYPTLTLEGRALLGTRWMWNQSDDNLEARFRRQGISAAACTKDWKRPCGYTACPAIARRVEGLRSIGVLIWDSHGAEEKDLTEWPMAWSLNGTCRNVHCENFGFRVWERGLSR